MIFALVLCYFGGAGGALVHFREETNANWIEAIGLSGLWPVWVTYGEILLRMRQVSRS
jgi:hypothetical protein